MALGYKEVRGTAVGVMGKSICLFLCGMCCTCSTLIPLGNADRAPLDEVNFGSGLLLRTYLAQRRTLWGSEMASRPNLVVLPFEDRSGFRAGVWDVELEMARLFSRNLAEMLDWSVVPFDVVLECFEDRSGYDTETSLMIGRRLEADVLLLCTLRDYDMRRVSVGDPLLGGYKSYAGVAEIEARAVRAADGRELAAVSTRQELVDRGLGLDLLGKPRDRDLQFVSLDQIAFGSAEFASTVIGRATTAALDDLANLISVSMQPGTLRMNGQVPEILSIHGDEIFINVGSENALRSGYRFAVYASTQSVGIAGQRLGVVEVVDIVGARLSRVRSVGKYGDFSAGDRLKLLAGDTDLDEGMQ